MAKTATCEDCGKRLQTAFGSDPRYQQGVRTATGFPIVPFYAAVGVIFIAFGAVLL